MSEHSFLLNSINLSQVEEEVHFRLAAIFVDDAMHKRRTESKNIRQNVQKDDRINRYIATTAFFLGHNRWFRRFVWLIIFVQLSLAIWERPSTRSPHESTMELRILAGIELFCLFIYSIDMFAKLLSLGPKNYFKQGWSAVKVLCVATMFVDVIIALIIPNFIRFSRPLRSYLLLEKSRTVKSVFWSILRTIPKMTPIFIMQAFLILLYAQFGTVIFHQTIGPSYKAFSTLTESMVSMFILTTTENYPDVMLPAYMKYQVSALFFISFLIISQLFLLNLVLAVFYETYSTHILDSVREGLVFRKESLIKAFEAIKEDTDVVVFANFERMMKQLKTNYSNEKIRFIFHMLDKDHDEELNQPEFLYLCEVMQWDFVQEKEYKIKTLSNLQLMMKTLERWYVRVRSMLIVCIALVTSLEVEFCSKKCEQLEIIENLFTVMFMIEILFCIFAYGPTEFFKNNWNKFDAFVISVCFVFDIILAKWIALEFIFLLKTLLLIRVIVTLDSLKVLVSTAIQLLPSLVCFSSILLSLFYFYAIIGMELFWGKINSSNPYFGPINYYYINFDSLTHTMVALYGLMTVNDWNTYMAGVVSATDSWARVYFMTFYLLAVVIVLSVILAFIIEAFVEQHKLKQAEEQVPKLNGHIEGSVWDDEIRTRIEFALKRSLLSATPGVKWRVEPKRNLETIYEVLLRANDDE